MHTFTHTHIHTFHRDCIWWAGKNFPFSQLYYQKSIFARVLFTPPLSAHLTNCEQLMLARFGNQTVWKLTRWLQLQVFLFSFYSSCLFFFAVAYSILFTLNRNLTFIQTQLVTAKEHSRQRYFCVLLLRFGFNFFFAWFLCVTHLHKWKNFTFVCCYLWLLVWFTDLFS